MRTLPLVLAALGIVSLLAVGAIVGPSANAVGPATVVLGRAGSFGVLGGGWITSTGASAISGDLGAPGVISGFPTPGTVNAPWNNHGADSATTGARTDLATAYGDALGRGTTGTAAADPIGATVLAGVYEMPTFTISGGAG